MKLSGSFEGCLRACELREKCNSRMARIPLFNCNSSLLKMHCCINLQALACFKSSDNT